MKAASRNRLAGRLAAGLVGLVFAGFAAGCGDAYRATVGTGTPVPVPTQPEYLPVVTSTVESPVACAQSPLDAGCTSAGSGSIFDASGDSTLAIETIGNQPVAAALGSGGGIAYVVNLGAYDQANTQYQGSVSSFTLTTNPQPGSVNTTTLDSAGDVFDLPGVPSAQTNPCTAAPAPAVFANANLIYVSQTSSPVLLPLSRNVSATGVPSLIDTLPVDGVITSFTGLTSGYLTYAIERDKNEVEVFDSTLATATTSPVRDGYGKLNAATGYTFSSPTFGVTSIDGNRVFILNCNGTITGINTQSFGNLQNPATNVVYTTIPVAAGQTSAGVPVWGDYLNSANLLVTANTNGSTEPGSVAVINGVEDTTQFGQVEGVVPVGINPSSVVVLQESAGTTSRAYVANDGDDDVTDTVPLTPTTTAPCDCKTVSVVPLSINGTPTGPAITVPLAYSQLDVTGTTYTTETCPADPVNGANAASSTGYPLQMAVTPDTVDQQVFVLCNQPSANGSYYVFAIRTYAIAGTSGGTAPGDVVATAIPVVGVPTQIKITPSR